MEKYLFDLIGCAALMASGVHFVLALEHFLQEEPFAFNLILGAQGAFYGLYLIYAP